MCQNRECVGITGVTPVGIFGVSFPEVRDELSCCTPEPDLSVSRESVIKFYAAHTSKVDSVPVKVDCAQYSLVVRRFGIVYIVYI
jgi:hypothetical protein